MYAAQRVLAVMSALVFATYTMSANGAERTDPVHSFIMALPKNELHIHLEGTVEPEDYLALVARNNLSSPYDSPEAVRERLTYQRDLNTFIEVYEELLSALVTTRDFEEAVVRYAGRVAARVSR